MPRPERTAAILVAAGRGLRAGSRGTQAVPRDRRAARDLPRHAGVSARHPDVFAVQPVVNPDDAAIFNAGCREDCATSRPPAGGATRQASVHAGLEALAAEKPDIVLIHDAARPFVTPAVISRAIDAAGRTGAAVPAIPVADTIKQVGETGRRRGDARARRGCESRRRRKRSASTSFSSMPIAAPRATAAAISPTMRRSRNGRD